MMKFSALNESSLSDDCGDPELATREAQEEEAYSIYHSALRKQYEGNLEESEEMFKDLLEMEFLTQAQPKEEKSAGPLGPALTLKYLVYKNLATITKEKEDYHSSVSYYLEALEIDSTDVMMWYNMGKTSINISNYSLSRLCFEEGLKCNPNHWPCIDNLITVMYTLNDYANCLFYIAQALERECYYLKGLVIKDHIYKEDPSLKSFCESYFKKCDPSIHFAEYDKDEADKVIQECMDMREKKRSFYKPKPLPVIALGHPIKEFTWANLGESLVNVYDCIANADPCVSFSCKIDLSPYLENKTSSEGNNEKPAPSPISSLSEPFSSNSVPPGQQNGTAAQSGFQDPGQMEVDEVSDVGKSDEVQPTLLLPQADVQTPDLSMYTDSTSSNKRAKRKRNEFAELSDFVSKRRSTRVRNPTIKRPLDNTNYQELLHKFLPAKLIGDGKFDEQDYDSDQLSQDKSNGEFGQCQDKKDSSNTSSSSDLCSTEKDEVRDFIAKNQVNGGIIDLLYRYLIILGTKSNLTWPKAIIDVFCSAFTRLRKHITIPNLFSRSTEVCRIKEMAWVFLVYCEFKVDQWYQNTGNSMPFSLKMSTTNVSLPTDRIGEDFHADMEFLVQVTSRSDIFGDEWLNFSARALWLKAKFHSLEGEIDLAVCCMRKLNDVLSDDEIKHKKITVQNCNVSSVIFASNVKQQLESLQRCQSLEEVQRLYEHGDYAAVVDLLKLTFNQPRTSRKQSLDGVPERHAQLLLLQNSLMKLERYKECVIWSEVSFSEALQQFMNATKNAEWSETMAQLLSGLDKCAKLDSSYLSELDDSKLVRLTQNLVLIIVIQMENYDFAGDNAALLVVLPWIILYRLILNEEKKMKAKSDKSNTADLMSGSKMASSSFLADFDLCASMPSSLKLLFTAHECLGRRSWCTACDGLLLLTFIDIMMSELQDTSGEAYLYREDLETGLEQCIYCLYGHPNKRSRAKHLQEHNAKQIPLTWERAVLIFQYFKPNILPEFDSYRTSTISAELENLFRKISTLVSSNEDPTLHVDSYTAYIEGGVDKCPDPPFGKRNLSIVVRDLYYLLGDYYFKNKEFGKAIRFYLCDICINPDRQDSWAGMALSRSSQLDQKLNSYELRNESTIYRKASAALRCFEHALELDPTTTSLWIEYGSLAYILHSHASRQLKQEAFCDEMRDMLKKKKTEMVKVAERCFRSANYVEDGGDPEEAWLHHYMLGKICEKEGGGPIVFLDHYKKALAYLHEDFARYPQKILYHNPAELSIEALEVYYRVHASCLKFLWQHESIGLDLAILKIIQECLREIKNSPFYTFQEKSKTDIICSSNAASETEEITPPKSVESQPRVDHNYSENMSINVKKISEDSRHSRPSTDSLPESQDILIIKEIIDSLVSVVDGRFTDEEKEKSCNNSTASDLKDEANEVDADQNLTKVVVESLAEESVYTTKSTPDPSHKTDEGREVALPTSTQEPMICEDTDELSKLKELAKELESKTAPSENQTVDSSVENASAPTAVVKEVPVPSVESSKDEEVLKSLSSILSSLEAAKNSDAVELKPTEVETYSAGKESQIKAAVDEVMEVDSVVSDDPAVRSDVKDTESTTECIQNVEVSTNDTAALEVAQKAAEMNEKTKDGKNDSSVVSEKKMDIDISTEEEKQISSQNKSDTSIVCISKGASELTENAKSDKDCDKSENVSLKNQPLAPAPSAEELKKSRNDIAKLIPKCLDAMRECLQRFPQHYKALFRMAHYYCHSTTPNKNLQWAREILLAATPATKKFPSMSGLFAERKNTNFFNGIWRAPSNEIDRPGSFGAHMYRSVFLLIEVLTQQKDYNMLVNLTLQLHRTPDLGKKYMRDTDRQFLVRKAYDACVNILRDQMNTLLQEEPPPEESRLICCLLEIYRTWMTLIKSSVNIDDSNDLLEEAYTMYRMGEVDFQPSVLEQAKNFCQIQLGKTYPERTRSDVALPEEHSLQPLYSQLDSSKFGASAKYATLPDVNASVSSASAYNPDAWQKELAESLMMPVLPCEGRVNLETKSVKPESKMNLDPLSLHSIDASLKNNSSATATSPSAVSPQMVHVEKPKAENLQACSVAFLPVTPAFPKENVSTSTVFQAPPLLSCQAFECFDVLTSIMQASGYQVSPQLGGMVQPFDPATAYNFKAQGKMPNLQGMYDNFQQPKANARLGRKRKRGRSSQKMEGLNLSKKMHTKPIVSVTIANSITQLKIDPVITSDKKPQLEPAQSSPLCLVKPKTNKRVPCYKTSSPTDSKGLDLTKKSAETMTSTQCSVIVSTSESLNFHAALDRNKDKTAKREKKAKRVVNDMLPDIYDFTEDSNLSTNLETSRIEKCAKEMLEFMNKKVEDTVLNEHQGTLDIAISKPEMDNIFKMLEGESNLGKNISQEGDFKIENLDDNQKELARQVNDSVKESTTDEKMEDDKKEISAELSMVENINQLSKDSTTEFNLFFSKPEDADSDIDKIKQLTLQNLVGEHNSKESDEVENLKQQKDVDEKKKNVEKNNKTNLHIVRAESISNDQENKNNETIEQNKDLSEKINLNKAEEKLDTKEAIKCKEKQTDDKYIKCDVECGNQVNASKEQSDLTEDYSSGMKEDNSDQDNGNASIDHCKNVTEHAACETRVDLPETESDGLNESTENECEENAEDILQVVTEITECDENTENESDETTENTLEAVEKKADESDALNENTMDNGNDENIEKSLEMNGYDETAAKDKTEEDGENALEATRKKEECDDEFKECTQNDKTENELEASGRKDELNTLNDNNAGNENQCIENTLKDTKEKEESAECGIVMEGKDEECDRLSENTESEYEEEKLGEELNSPKQDPGKSQNENDDSDEISMPKLEAEAAEPLGECSTSHTRECDVIRFGHNKTKNINYSILKKDCVVVIRLQDERNQKKDFNFSDDEQDSRDTDDDD